MSEKNAQKKRLEERLKQAQNLRNRVQEAEPETEISLSDQQIKLLVRQIKKQLKKQLH